PWVGTGLNGAPSSYPHIHFSLSALFTDCRSISRSAARPSVRRSRQFYSGGPSARKRAVQAVPQGSGGPTENRSSNHWMIAVRTNFSYDHSYAYSCALND